jgi:hypothetical protein
LSEGVYYTDEELVEALRSRLAELELLAGELEEQVLAAQARLGALIKEVRARAEEAEDSLASALVPTARVDAAEAVDDARRRASELGLNTATQLEVGDLGRLLVTHFELQERLVQLVAEVLQREH